MPKDGNNQTFPEVILKFRNINAKQHTRDRLVWNQHKELLYCFPCGLFWNNVCCRLSASKSALATVEGWPSSAKWRKLCNRVSEHEKSNRHRKCYVTWQELERRLLLQESVKNLSERSIKVKSEKWYNILKRIIDVTLFLGERDLAFRGSSQRIGDSNIGKLAFHWNLILEEYVLRVEALQKKGERLQVHYLSNESPNEFIAECFDLAKQHILSERLSAKYFEIIIDFIPDLFHVEQATFLLRYLVWHESQYKIVERFLKFVDCSKKTRSKIAQMITETLESHAIPLADCRTQGYDNAASMSSKYDGAQAIIKEQYTTAMFSPCGCHTLNLCNNNAAECTVFQKQVPILKLYKQYTLYLVAASRGGKYYQSELVLGFMAYLAPDDQIK